MKFSLSTRSIKGYIQAALALAILLFNLGPGGTRIVLAAPPANDNFASAELINSITYTDSLVVTEATPTNSIPNVNDPDNIVCEGGTRKAGFATVWYKYTPMFAQSISLDTLGSNYDTFIAVWTGTIGSLSLVKCNDDTFENQQSELFFTANAGTTYYIEVAQFAGFVGDPSSPPASCDELAGGCNLQFHAYITTTDVIIAGAVKGKYFIPPGGSLRRGFLNVDNGPAQIKSTNGASIIAALRVIWQETGERTSYSETMGLPLEQLSTEYWFPWYNNLDTPSMDQGFRIATVNATGSNTIEVRVGGTLQDSFSLAAGASVRVDYPVNNGPAQIVCTTCTLNEKIITTLRVIWQEPPGRTSYSEMMGLPKEALSTEYWFPWYNNLDIVSMDQGFRIATVNATGPNTIEVRVGGVLQESFSLAAGASVRVGYPVNNGPARIVCTTCTLDEKIITTLRVIWQEPPGRTSYSEMMGLPLEQLSKEYWFPWYNNMDTNSMDQGFRIANVDTTPHTVEVWIGGIIRDTISLGAGASIRKNYNVNNGPVRILCTTCNIINTNDRIITALRVIWQEPPGRTSYSEMMGLPVDQLSTEYWFPWYNNALPASMDQGFRFGVP